jgi:hypothetical protein
MRFAHRLASLRLEFAFPKLTFLKENRPFQVPAGWSSSNSQVVNSEGRLSSPFSNLAEIVYWPKRFQRQQLFFSASAK